MSICKFSRSSRLLFPCVLATLSLNTVMLLPTAKGLEPVNGVNGPPLTLPRTLDEGMLLPAPLASATAALLKNAYKVTFPAFAGRTQLVVMVMVELPLATPFDARAKFTKPGAAATVSEEFRSAFRFTAATFDFNCAWRAEAHASSSASKARTVPVLRSSRIIISGSVSLINFLFLGLIYLRDLGRSR